MPTPEKNAYLQTAFGIDPAAFSSAAAAGAQGQVGNSSGQPPAKTTSPPQTNADRKDPNAPTLTSDQEADEDMKMAWYREAYDAALQGASGKYPDAEKATEVAKQIAEEAIKTQPKRVAELTKEQVEISVDTYKKFFYEAIQGLASGPDATPNAIVMKAHAMSLRSLELQEQEKRKLKWEAATLPQPMAPDCKAVSGKVRGPDNHVLCKTHGHVMDTETKMVIAHSIEEYRASKK